LFCFLQVWGFLLKALCLLLVGEKDILNFSKKIFLEAGLEKKGYVVIIPFASAEPDLAVFYAQKQFAEIGLQKVGVLDKSASAARLDSIKNAKLIYFTGGDQNKLMATFRSTHLY